MIRIFKDELEPVSATLEDICKEVDKMSLPWKLAFISHVMKFEEFKFLNKLYDFDIEDAMQFLAYFGKEMME